MAHLGGERSPLTRIDQFRCTRTLEEMDAANAEYRCPVYTTADLSAQRRLELLERPVKTSADILALVSPILSQVREQGDAGLRACVVKFDRCVPAQDDKWPLVLQAPFSDELAKIDPKVKEAIDVAYSNIKVSEETCSLSSLVCPDR